MYDGTYSCSIHGIVLNGKLENGFENVIYGKIARSQSTKHNIILPDHVCHAIYTYTP